MMSTTISVEIGWLMLTYSVIMPPYSSSGNSSRAAAFLGTFTRTMCDIMMALCSSSGSNLGTMLGSSMNSLLHFRSTKIVP